MSADKRPSWTPTDTPSSAKPTCQRCGDTVSKRFARVFGDNENEVHGCLNCLNASEIKRRGTLKDCDGRVADGLKGGSIYGGV